MIKAQKSGQPVSTKGEQRVYLFADGHKAFGTSQVLMREMLGGKGAGLAEMASQGVNVPPGFTLVTSCCRHYYDNNQALPEDLMEEVQAALSVVEEATKRRLGDPDCPLLVSVRSGAKFSMPGMMDTILNLGMNDITVKKIAGQTGSPRFAWDSYRRFIQMYAAVVLGVSKGIFEDLIDDRKEKVGVAADADLDETSLRLLVDEFKRVVWEKAGQEFPQDASEQLQGAIEAVLRSWNNPRAVYYRKLHRIDNNLGTAVTVQAMVFGNRDECSATGVCFTRNPSTGRKELYGEYLVNAQGEDVVAGTRTPRCISEMRKEMPEVYEELLATTGRLEEHYGDVQDIEFTIQSGRLYLLQTRTAKRTAAAAVKIAVDMASERIISKEAAVNAVEASQLNQLLLPSFDEADKARATKEKRHLATGLNASPGAAIGEIVFDPDEADRLSGKGRKVILVRIETCPDDIHGIVAAQGIVTSRGGMTSHAAVVARGMGKPCVAGCEALRIDLAAGSVEVDGQTLLAGDIISIDGGSGEIFKGTIQTHAPRFSEEFRTVLSWADEIRSLSIRANADTPEDASRAREFGAEGIGLCRTEHMFMSQERLPVVQEMIMAASAGERQQALNKLLPMQRGDFKAIFKVMSGLPVTIRLLDPPLHEFLPKYDELVAEIASLESGGKKGPELLRKQALLKKVFQLRESNPMMGLRGCRLGLLYPEISRMQVTAIFEAAIQVKKEGIEVLPEIMIPLVGHVNELKVARAELEAEAQAVMEREGMQIAYSFGTMIEVPRAALTANEIAEHAEFFSFGTNDLTQMTFGFSRDDAEGKFLQRYLEGIDCLGRQEKILTANPFEILDQSGVGKLMKIAVEYGLQARPDLKLGICGEHGGEPESIAFAHELGLDYVSCSPFRVPAARLAAAQANLARQYRDR